MRVPFLDIKLQNEPLRTEIRAAIDAVIENSSFAGGPFVEAFEKNFAAYCGARHAVGVGNGTDALWLTLLAMDVGPGDEVITVPSTFMGTAEPITYCGARPVFIDIDERTYCMDPDALKRAITDSGVPTSFMISMSVPMLITVTSGCAWSRNSRISLSEAGRVSTAWVEFTRSSGWTLKRRPRPAATGDQSYFSPGC